MGPAGLDHRTEPTTATTATGDSKTTTTDLPRRTRQCSFPPFLPTRAPSVATIQGDATVADAVEELNRHHVGALVVSSDGETIDGIISERDVVRSMSQRREAVLGDTVSSIMSATVSTCSLDDDTESLMRMMTERRIRHVPVVDEGRLCGIVSYRRRREEPDRGTREEPVRADRIHHRPLTSERRATASTRSTPPTGAKT